MSDTDRIAGSRLTDDLNQWLGQLAEFTAGHRALACDCGSEEAHQVRHTELMSAKADLLARCREAEGVLRGSPAPRPFPRPDWWGEHGCRHAGQPGHVCLDVFGRALAGGHPCVAEARSAMVDLFEAYQPAGGGIRIHGLADVAVRVAEKLRPMAGGAVGQ